jgi:hypothetical protein
MNLEIEGIPTRGIEMLRNNINHKIIALRNDFGIDYPIGISNKSMNQIMKFTKMNNTKATGINKRKFTMIANCIDPNRKGLL